MKAYANADLGRSKAVCRMRPNDATASALSDEGRTQIHGFHYDILSI